MKTLPILHFSGYPLTVTQPHQWSKQKGRKTAIVTSNIKVVKPKESDIANNPINWDESWFCNYE